MGRWMVGGALMGAAVSLSKYLGTFITCLGCMFGLIILGMTAFSIALVFKAPWVILIIAGVYYGLKWLRNRALMAQVEEREEEVRAINEADEQYDNAIEKARAILKKH